MNVPTFAVVGPPNKGKSSIVSTLAYDDSVAIGPDPGTTTRSRRYPMNVDEEILYVLVDTPGFQRPRAVLEWMQARETTADRHPEVVRRFVAQHRRTDRYPDEVELLTPLLDGAGILYVVDGSVPYGPQYEHEMQILRWTGCARMALINPIDSTAHIDVWRTALGQYFSVVRVFNPMDSDVRKRIELLKAFGQLQDDWRQPLSRAVRLLQEEQDRRRNRSAALIASMLEDMITLRLNQRIREEGDLEKATRELQDQYRQRLMRVENKTRDRVEEVYGHHGLQREEDWLPLLNQTTLFSEETWKVFGLTRQQLLGAGAVSGGAVGGAIDLAAGGATFLAGTLIGAAIGAGAVFFAGNRLAEIKILNIPMGGRELVMGPVENPNFPHVALGRARLHHAIVARRTHAQRGALHLQDALLQTLPTPTSRLHKALEAEFARLRKSKEPEPSSPPLRAAVAELLEADERRAG
jgi:hypothetical protein